MPFTTAQSRASGPLSLTMRVPIQADGERTQREPAIEREQRVGVVDIGYEPSLLAANRSPTTTTFTTH